MSELSKVQREATAFGLLVKSADPETIAECCDLLGVKDAMDAPIGELRRKIIFNYAEGWE